MGRVNGETAGRKKKAVDTKTLSLSFNNVSVRGVYSILDTGTKNLFRFITKKKLKNKVNHKKTFKRLLTNNNM